MNLSQLEILVAIVETGSLTEAGERVGLTQSAVSYSLSKLEAELGVILLERGRQGIEVTRIGNEVLQHARQMLAQVEIIRQKTARERGMSVGKIRFGCVPTIPPRLLTGIIRDFQHQYPEIDIVLFEGIPSELVDWLNSGVIDVATVLNPHDYAESYQLVHDELKVVVSVDNPLTQTSVVDMQALMQQAFIGPKKEYGIMYDRLGFKDSLLTTRYEVTTPNTILAMIRENMGFSIIPDMLIDRELDGLACLSFQEKRYVDIWLGAKYTSPAIATFMTMAHQWVQEHGYLKLHE